MGIACHRRYCTKKTNYNDAQDYYHQSLAHFNKVGNRVDQAHVLNSLGATTLAQNQLQEAKEHFEHALAIAHEQKALQLEGRALRGMGDVARAQQQFTEAERFYGEAARIAVHLDTLAERCAILHRQGELYQIQGKYREALEAWVQAYIQDRRVGHPDRESLKERIDALVAEHDFQQAFAAAWAEGRKMTLEQIQAAPEPYSTPSLVPTESHLSSTVEAPSEPSYDRLTVRELEVLRLVAQGWTDVQIVEQLVISRRTVNAHLTSIYRKIHISTRNAAIRYAIERKLV
jgi:DNA-binding NarL/FixJ family response regulator